MVAIVRASKWLMVVAVVLLALGAPGSALAKKKGKKNAKGKSPKVELVGIESFDKVFRQLRKLDNTVGSAEKEANKSQRNLNSALGIKNDTPVKKGLDNLKNRADGKIGVATKGGVPSLKATDAVPKNVENAINAVNVMVSSFSASLGDLGDAVQQSKELSSSVAKMPANVKDEFMKDSGSFLDLLFKLPKTIKAVGGNLKVATSLPGRSASIIGKMTNIVGAVTSTFSPL
ncbi:MAG: hypothetical protein ACI8PZ_005768 [Myxococcota bacterium]|jgi:hypothetical protein